MAVNCLMLQPQRQCNSHFERAITFSNTTTKVNQTDNHFQELYARITQICLYSRKSQDENEREKLWQEDQLTQLTFKQKNKQIIQFCFSVILSTVETFADFVLCYWEFFFWRFQVHKKLYLCNCTSIQSLCLAVVASCFLSGHPVTTERRMNGAKYK